MRGVSPIEQRGDDVFLTVRVQPRASREAVRIEPDGLIRVSVTAPPVEGAANDALVKYLAGILGVPRRAVAVRSGQKGRTKTVAISGAAADAVKAGLAAAENRQAG